MTIINYSRTQSCILLFSATNLLQSCQPDLSEQIPKKIEIV